MDWGRWRGREAGAAERIAHAAAPLLIVRTGEGLAAWIFFNEFFWSPTRFRWMVQAAFVGYFLLNLLVTLRERRGSVSASLFSLDIAANVATLALPVAASGGLASPLLLLFPLKALHYAMVFGVAAAGVLLASTVAMLAIVETALPVTHLAADTAATVMEVAVLGFLIGAPAAMAWLATSLAEGPPRHPPRRLEQEATSTAVAEALLKVSEAVSRLTRLDEILEKVVEIAPHSVDVDECGLALWAEDTGTYTGVVASGGGKAIDGRFAGLHFSPEEAHDFEWVRRLGHCAVVPAPEGAGSSATNVPAVLIAPLLSGARFYGVMEFARDSARRPFNQRDLTIADGIARQTAVALERARLIEDSRRLVLAVESTEEAVLITDANRRVMFANLAFMRTFGYRREELIGRDASDLAGEDRAWLPEVQETMHRRSWRGETVAYGKNGVAIPILLNVSLIRGDDGRVQGAVAIMEDISAEKTFQAQMQRADRLAAVGEMAAGIAHEINNALAAIFGQTQNTASRGEVELRSALERVDAQAGRIAEIVQGVLGFARPRPPRPEPLDLAALTVKTLDLVRHDLDRQGVKVSTDFDLDLPRAQADPQQVQQVLLNLFGNALQAMAGGAGAHLHIEVLGVDDRLAVRVTDDGPGIATRDLAPHLRSLLLDQAGGHRSGVERELCDRPSPRRRPSRPEREGFGHHVHSLPAHRRTERRRGTGADPPRRRRPRGGGGHRGHADEGGARGVSSVDGQGGAANAGDGRLGRDLSRRPAARSVRARRLRRIGAQPSRAGATRGVRHRRRVEEREPTPPAASGAASPRQALHTGPGPQRPAPAPRSAPSGGVSRSSDALYVPKTPILRRSGPHLDACRLTRPYAE